MMKYSCNKSRSQESDLSGPLKNTSGPELAPQFFLDIFNLWSFSTYTDVYAYDYKLNSVVKKRSLRVFILSTFSSRQIWDNTFNNSKAKHPANITI